MANILSQAKDLYKMQQEARSMQKKMKQVVVAGNSRDKLVEIKINGLNEIEEIEIDDEIMSVARKQQLQRNIQEAFQDAAKKLQKELMKDMDLGKMKSMLGM